MIEKMLNDFKKFLLRGNVVDLAVGVVVGAAFGNVVSSLVSDILTPIISVITPMPDFSAWVFTLRGGKFNVGHFLNTILSFLIVSAGVFFFVVRPMNLLVAKYKNKPTPDPTTKKCPECLSEIPVKAKRCSFCAQPVKSKQL